MVKYEPNFKTLEFTKCTKALQMSMIVKLPQSVQNLKMIFLIYLIFLVLVIKTAESLY